VSFARPFQRLPRGRILIALALPNQKIVSESAIEVRVRCLSEPCSVVTAATSPAPRRGTTRALIADGEAETHSAAKRLGSWNCLFVQPVDQTKRITGYRDRAVSFSWPSVDLGR
jgi:hypothetical protein